MPKAAKSRASKSAAAATRPSTRSTARAAGNASHPTLTLNFDDDGDLSPPPPIPEPTTRLVSGPPLPPPGPHDNLILPGAGGVPLEMQGLQGSNEEMDVDADHEEIDVDADQKVVKIEDETAESPPRQDQPQQEQRRTLTRSPPQTTQAYFEWPLVEIDGIEWDLRQNHELANGIMNRLPPRRRRTDTVQERTRVDRAIAEWEDGRIWAEVNPRLAPRAQRAISAWELECEEAALERQRETELEEAAQQARNLFERAERNRQAAMPNLVRPRNLGNPIRPDASIRPITASPPEPPRQNRQITSRQGRGRQGIPRQETPQQESEERERHVDPDYIFREEPLEVQNEEARRQEALFRQQDHMLDDDVVPAANNDTDDEPEYEILSTPPPQAQAQAQARAQEALRQAMINFPQHEWPDLYILLEGNQNWTYILNVDVSPIAILNNLRTAVSTADAAVRRAALNTVRLGSMAVEPEIIQARVDWLRREGININRDPFTANKRKLMGVVTSNQSALETQEKAKGTKTYGILNKVECDQCRQKRAQDPNFAQCRSRYWNGPCTNCGGGGKHGACTLIASNLATLHEDHALFATKMTSALGLFETARQTQDIKDFQKAFRVFSLAIAANTRCLGILAPGLVQRGIQLLNRENTQFDEDTEEGQMMGAMVRNVVAQDNALSGGGTEAGPSTPRRPGPTFESVTASSFVVSPTNREQARFRQIRDDEEQRSPDTSASTRRQGKRPMPGQGRLGRGGGGGGGPSGSSGGSGASGSGSK